MIPIGDRRMLKGNGSLKQGPLATFMLFKTPRITQGKSRWGEGRPGGLPLALGHCSFGCRCLWGSTLKLRTRVSYVDICCGSQNTESLVLAFRGQVSYPRANLRLFGGGDGANCTHRTLERRGTPTSCPLDSTWVNGNPVLSQKSLNTTEVRYLWVAMAAGLPGFCFSPSLALSISLKHLMSCQWHSGMQGTHPTGRNTAFLSCSINAC